MFDEFQSYGPSNGLEDDGRYRLVNKFFEVRSYEMYKCNPWYYFHRNEPFLRKHFAVGDPLGVSQNVNLGRSFLMDLKSLWFAAITIKVQVRESGTSII